MPDTYVCDLFEAAVQVRFDAAVAQKLAEAATTLPGGGGSAAESGGILLGRVSRTGGIATAEITGIETIPPHDFYRLAAFRIIRPYREQHSAAPESLQEEVVGFFRTDTSNSAKLNDDDRMLLQTYSVEPFRVGLLVCPTDRVLSISMFYISRHRTRSVLLDVPVSFAPRAAPPPQRSSSESFARAPQAGAASEVTHPVAPSSAAAASAENREIPGAPAPAHAPWTRSRVLAAGSAFALCCIIAGGVLYRAPQQPWAADPAQADSDTLSLSVASRGPDLQVTWRRDLAALNDARAGILWILDGDSHTEIPLDVEQLRTGMVMYSPVTERVQFRLQIILSSGRDLSASAIAATGRRPPASKRSPAKPRVTRPAAAGFPPEASSRSI